MLYGKIGKFPYTYGKYPFAKPFGKYPFYGKYPYGASTFGGFNSVVPSTTVVTSPVPGI